MLHSLRLRLLLALCVVIVVALAVVALFGSRAASTEFQRYVDSESMRRGRSMAELMIYYRQNRSWENVQPLLEQMAQISGDRILLADSEGRVIADSLRELIIASEESDEDQRRFGELDTGVEPFTTIAELDRSFGRAAVLITSPDVPPVYVYISSANSASESSGANVFLGSVNRQLLLAAAAAGVAGLLLTVLFSRRILRPVEALTAAARKMEQGDLSQRVAVQSRDEIGELALAFNAMADGIARQERLRRNMVSDVAHELRTPLANLRGYLEAMRDGVVTPDATMVRSLHDEVMLLAHLVDDLQDLAQAEAGKMTLATQPMALEETVYRVVHQLQPQAAEKNLTVHVRLPADLPLVDANEERVGQVLRNLLSNAIVYTPPGGQVTVSAEVDEGMAAVRVSDTGVGIPPEHLANIFDRFYRIDRSRARATGGSGLGLAIVKQWVEAHGGRVWAESTVGEGSTITFTLPVAEMQLASV